MACVLTRPAWPHLPLQLFEPLPLLDGPQLPLEQVPDQRWLAALWLVKLQPQRPPVLLPLPQ